MLIDFKYLFKKFNVKCNGILHCGGSTGQEAEMYYTLNIPKVIWIEAIPSVYKKLIEHISKYQNQFAINACISNVDEEEVYFNVSNNEAQSSSFLELAHHTVIHPTVHYIKSIKLRTSRLDTLLSAHDIENINFGNFDLQGTELLALRGLGKLINQFDYFYLEVNKREVYKNCALIGDIDDFLSDYKRVATSQFIGDSWGDAFYVKKSLL